jgi:prolyl-tRNA editing enzyme YbaK/EbsC (Cys-tRNA(Pro) deacylase)
MKTPIKIFVGSSNEAIQYSLEVRALIEKYEMVPVSWQEIFKPGDFTLDALLRITEEVDAAILIASPDDETWYRMHKRMEPRDNILFELGLFIAELGRYRTCILRITGKDKEPATLPTDLLGVTYINYHFNQPASNENQLQQWFNKINNSIQLSDRYFERVARILKGNFSSLPNLLKEKIVSLILEPFKGTISKALKGEIILSPGQYYQELFKELKSVDTNTRVYAINTLSHHIWNEDYDQQRYLQLNIEAAKRGCKIRRLYVHNIMDFIKISKVLQNQLDANIEIRQLIPAEFYSSHPLEDMVIFYDKINANGRVYITEPAFDNPRRIRLGKLILDEHECYTLKELFFSVWNNSRQINSSYLRSFSISSEQIDYSPPGKKLKAIFLTKPVVSCEEAATEKCIPLENELKTLMMNTSKGIIALHVRGNKKANLRSLKNALECDEVFLLEGSKLKEIGLSPGTVSAVLEPVWSYPHFISRSLLSLEFVSTNNGTLKGYFQFSPKLLLNAKTVTLGNFETD